MPRPKKVVSRKSVPSRVADAEELEPSAELSTAPAEVPEVAVAAPAKAAKKTDADLMRESVSEAINSALRESIPMAVMAGAQAVRPAQAAPKVFKQQCMECLQPQMACEGRHRKLVVLPKGAKAAHFFPGIFINGARYLSAHPNHLITIPEDAGIERMIYEYEQSEERFYSGRSYSHNSGSIGRNGTGFNPATGPSF